jgi:hypothetical protein
MAVASDDSASVVDQAKVQSSFLMIPGRQTDEDFVGARVTDM